MVTLIGDGCRAAGFLPIAMPPVYATPSTQVDSDLSTFATAVRDDFGILVGRPEDDPIIRRNNLWSPEPFGPMTFDQRGGPPPQCGSAAASPCRNGLRKSYADGRTIVTTAPEVIVWIPSARTSEQLLSELISDAVRQHAGAVGVMVREVLSPIPRYSFNDSRQCTTRRGFLTCGSRTCSRRQGCGERG